MELTELVCDVVGYKGEIEHDLSKPDGTPRKLMDVSLLAIARLAREHAAVGGPCRSYHWFCEEARRLPSATASHSPSSSPRPARRIWRPHQQYLA